MAVVKTVSADGTITLKITIPSKEVEEAREKVIETLIKNVTVPGFRKGMAPKNVSEPHLKKEVVQEEVLKNVLGKAYNNAITSEKITPIITPRVHVETFEDGTDLVFLAETAEAPVVNLGDYKEKVKSVTAKSKIAVPGKEIEKPKLDDILDEILKSTKIEIPKVLYEQEATRLLTQLLNELKRLGISLDQYLATSGKTDETLKAEYEEKAKRDLQIEFVLRKIADSEKITVEEKDIQQALADIKDEKQRAQIMQNPYLVASIIRQQKTLDFLSNL